MRVLDLIRGKHRFAVACAAGALVGAVAGLFTPIRAPAPPKSEQTNWSLPNAQSLKRFRGEQYEAVRNAAFWGELQTAGRRGAAKPTGWTMSAIATRPFVQVAVDVPGKPHQVGWVRLGGELPDGSTLVAANSDTIWYQKDGCKRTRKLYSKPDAATDACIGDKKAEPAASPAAAGKPAAAPAPTARNSR